MRVAMNGVITTYDPADQLGWIELMDGRKARFGLSACPTFAPAPGIAVTVKKLDERRGVLRAENIRARSGIEKAPRRYVLDRFDQSDRDRGAPAALFVKWLAIHDLLAPKHADDAARIRRGELTARTFISRVCDEKPASDDLAEAGLRFWLHYYGKPSWISLFKTRFQKDLLRITGAFESIYTLDERSSLEPAVFEAIDHAFAAWST
jgi:hypothetical protein